MQYIFFFDFLSHFCYFLLKMCLAHPAAGFTMRPRPTAACCAACGSFTIPSPPPVHCKIIRCFHMNNYVPLATLLITRMFVASPAEVPRLHRDAPDVHAVRLGARRVRPLIGARHDVQVAPSGDRRRRHRERRARRQADNIGTVNGGDRHAHRRADGEQRAQAGVTAATRRQRRLAQRVHLANERRTTSDLWRIINSD